MSRVIAWRQPPESLETRGRKPSEEYIALAYELKAKPGQWAYIGIRKASSVASNIQKAKVAAFAPAGSFEARAVKAEDGKDYDIYVRFVGEPSA